MEEAMDLLENIRDLDLDMQNLGRKIDAIDNGVRNRAYTLVEIKRQEPIEAELKEKRKERAELLLKLERILDDQQKRKDLNAELMSRYQNARDSEERSQIGQYVEITRQVTSNISKRKMASRINDITEAKKQSSRFGQKYSTREDDGAR